MAMNTLQVVVQNYANRLCMLSADADKKRLRKGKITEEEEILRTLAVAG